MTREAYIRALVVREGWELIAGVEFRDGDDFAALLDAAREPLLLAQLVHPPHAAAYVEAYIRERWPDRAFFLEIAQHPERGWIQVYDPMGFIKERCPCAR